MGMARRNNKSPILERSEKTKSQIPNLGHVDQIWDDPNWDLVIRGPKIPNPKKYNPPLQLLILVCHAPKDFRWVR